MHHLAGVFECANLVQILLDSVAELLQGLADGADVRLHLMDECLLRLNWYEVFLRLQNALWRLLPH